MTDWKKYAEPVTKLIPCGKCDQNYNGCPYSNGRCGSHNNWAHFVPEKTEDGWDK